MNFYEREMPSFKRPMSERSVGAKRQAISPVADLNFPPCTGLTEGASSPSPVAVISPAGARSTPSKEPPTEMVLDEGLADVSCASSRTQSYFPLSNGVPGLSADSLRATPDPVVPLPPGLSADSLRMDTTPDPVVPRPPDLSADSSGMTADNIPSGDWLEQYIQEMSTPDDIVDAWRLGYNVFLSVHFSAVSGTRIHIRSVTESGALSKRGIVIIPATWACFIEKLVSYNTNYTSSSMICNNQLAILKSEGMAVLMQISPSTSTPFNMKTAYIKLIKEQLDEILNNADKINNVVQNTYFCVELRRGLQRLSRGRQRLQQHECSRSILFNTIYNELCANLEKLFFCEGCVWNHPSQRRHDCMDRSTAMKYAVVGGKGFSSI